MALWPHYYPRPSIIHRVPAVAKAIYVFFAIGVASVYAHLAPIRDGYLSLGAVLLLSGAALMIATNARAALRIVLLPLLPAVVWTIFFVLVTTVHWQQHLRGRTHDVYSGGLAEHLLTQLTKDLQKPLGLFAASAAFSAVIVSTAANDLTRAGLPPHAVRYVELFFSMFVRLGRRVQRVQDAQTLAGIHPRWWGILLPTRQNPALALPRTLTVLVITVLTDIPGIYNNAEHRSAFVKRRKL